jgi:hypothetical protein
MGTTTAGLPLRSGEHYEKCPECATVYRTKRRQRFRCPGCHALAYAVPTAEGEPGVRRTLEGDPAGAVYRILEGRPADGQAAPKHGDDVVLFLEDPDAPPPAPGVPPSPPPGPAPPPRSKTRAKAERERDRGAPAAGGILGRVWRGSLGDLFGRGR